MPTIGAVADHLDMIIQRRAMINGAHAQRQAQHLNEALIEEQATGWLWAARAKAFEDIFEEIQQRYPNDPLFRKVHGTAENGKPKMVLHQKLQAAFQRHFMPKGPIRTRALQYLPGFLANRKL